MIRPQHNTKSLWFVAFAALFFSAGCGSPLVGLECRSGYAECGGGCADLQSSPNHCGGCDIECASNEMCVSGSCTDDVDGAIPSDGGDPDGSSGDPDGGEPDGATDAGDMWPEAGEGGMDASLDGGVDGSVDSGFPDVDLPPLCTGPGSPVGCVCDLGELICQQTCINGNIDSENCGACGNDCNAVPPPDGEFFCINGACVLDCDVPYSVCGGNRCVDLQIDPLNCGSCGNVCDSGLCEDGLCLDATAGHVIVVGHDMSDPGNTTAVRRIAENSMFLPPKATVRGLIYKEHSTAAARNGVENVINSAVAAGRTFARVADAAAGAEAEDVPLLLARSDVFVITSQANTTDDVLRGLGDLWSRALRAFILRGGVIVLFDGGGTHSGTQQILEEAGLFPVASRTPLTPREVNIEAPGDAVASLVPMRYQAQNETVGYTGTDGTVVVSDRSTGLAVVVHIAR